MSRLSVGLAAAVLVLCAPLSSTGAANTPDSIAALGKGESPQQRFEAKLAWQASREPARQRAFAAAFREGFNSADMTPLVTRTAPSALEAMPAERMLGFLGMLKSDNGAIDRLRFKYFDTRNQRQPAEPLAVYLLEFANGSRWEFRFGLDGEDRLTRFIFTDSNHNEDLPLIAANTLLQLPFAPGEQWEVLWGGESEEQNYHVVSRAQKNAFDFLIRHPWSKKTFDGEGRRNEDYYAFGRAILAPADGVVTTAIDGVADNSPGTMNPDQLTGNTVVIRSAEGEYILLAHLKNGSVRVKEGDRVSAGAPVGQCGNSGNSSEPHLHLHVMDKPTLSGAIGLKAYFDRIILDGISPASRYSPVRANLISAP